MSHACMLQLFLAKQHTPVVMHLCKKTPKLVYSQLMARRDLPEQATCF